MAIIFGTLGPDNLIGTLNNDHIFAAPLFQPFQDKSADTVAGGAGNDEILTYGGPDVVFGGTGIDTIKGLTGDDTLNGGGDNDIIQGGSGNDLLHGNGGFNQIDGGDGNDQLFADGGGVLFGGNGNDALTGPAEVLSGSAGDDTLTGGLFLNAGPGVNLVTGHGSGSRADARLYQISTFDGANDYGTGTHKTTITDFSIAADDDLQLIKAYYADGTKVTNADTTGNGVVNSADKGWSVKNTATGVALHFAGWNHEVILKGLTHIPADKVQELGN